jgi:hypothetical protein
MSAVAEPDPAAPPHREEQRGAPREVIPWGVFGRVGTRPERVLLHDVSANGIALIFSEPPPVGTVVALRLPGHGAAPGRLAEAEVRHVARLGDRIWLAGCALSSPLSEEEIQSLLRTGDDAR